MGVFSKASLAIGLLILGVLFFVPSSISTHLIPAPQAEADTSLAYSPTSLASFAGGEGPASAPACWVKVAFIILHAAEKTPHSDVSNYWTMAKKKTNVDAAFTHSKSIFTDAFNSAGIFVPTFNQQVYSIDKKEEILALNTNGELTVEEELVKGSSMFKDNIIRYYPRKATSSFVNKLREKFNIKKDTIPLLIVDWVQKGAATGPSSATSLGQFGPALGVGGISYLDGYVNSNVYSTDSLGTTIAHELGHAHGLGHVYDPFNLMYSTDTYDGFNTGLTTLQAAAFRAHGQGECAMDGSFTPEFAGVITSNTINIVKCGNGLIEESGTTLETCESNFVDTTTPTTLWANVIKTPSFCPLTDKSKHAIAVHSENISKIIAKYGKPSVKVCKPQSCTCEPATDYDLHLAGYNWTLPDAMVTTVVDILDKDVDVEMACDPTNASCGVGDWVIGGGNPDIEALIPCSGRPGHTLKDGTDYYYCPLHAKCDVGTCMPVQGMCACTTQYQGSDNPNYSPQVIELLAQLESEYNEKMETLQVDDR